MSNDASITRTAVQPAKDRTAQAVKERAAGRNRAGGSVRAVVFADITGSGGLYQSFGDLRAMSLITRCLVAMEEQVYHHRGEVIKTVGEGMLSLFPDANTGASAVIAQGVEAGGHVQGMTPLLTLVREITATLALPVVAAGGIADSAGAERALNAGAQAVACGTAFLAATEADVHRHYRARLIAAGAGDTELTDLFDIGWPNAPHRVIRNRTVIDWESAGRPPAGCRPGEGDVVGKRGRTRVTRYSDAQPTTSTDGDIESMAMYAGTSVDHVRRVAPSAAITEAIAFGIRRR